MKTKLAIIFLIFVTALSFQLEAQGFTESSYRSGGGQTVSESGNDAIPVGPFLFSPGVQLSWEHHSNLFQSAASEVEDDIYVARLRLLFELPVRESFIRISYTPQYRDSKNRTLFNSWDHYVEITGNFEFASGFLLDAGYRMVDGDVAVNEVDPGNELLFSGRTFTKHNFKINGDYWVSERDGLRIGADLSTVSWHGQPQPYTNSWFDYDQWNGTFGWLHQLSPTMVMDLSYGYTDYSPDGASNQFRSYSSNDLTLGFKGSLNEVLSTRFRMGFLKTDYDAEASLYPGFDDFSGFIAEGSLTWEMAHGSRLRLDLVNRPYASNYDQNSYYTATVGRLLYDLQMDRLFAQARLLSQSNDYDVPDSLLGRKRSDDILTWDVGIGFRLTDYLSLRGRYIHEDRDSNLDEYGFLNKVYMIDLVLGY